jgi:hypothetical protein
MNEVKDDAHKKMDWFARMWERAGLWFARRPVMVIGTLLGAVLFATLMGILIFKQNKQATSLHEVQSVFCNGAIEVPTPEQAVNCQRLFDQLLRDPTEAQAVRLREIIKETP